MSDWRVELEALRAQTDAYAHGVAGKIVSPQHAPPTVVVQTSVLRPIDWGGSEREKIGKRVANFRAHQRRLAREREEFASSTIAKLRRRDPQ
ncbi:hypothetical protein [Bradyrhizobium genosp. A]|uniref:hypothetical protein n=1 Tax=Bradyrhizobium genosp. A TaxID=83626 RepID=UPI003CF24A41